jgi:PDZ domain
MWQVVIRKLDMREILRSIALVMVTVSFGVCEADIAFAQNASTAGHSATAAVSPLSMFVDKRLVIHLLANCPSDPDPLGILDLLPGFTQDQVYSDCDQNELDQLRGWLAADITEKKVFAGIVGTGGELTLTVTLTRDQEIGKDSVFSDLANADRYISQASYRLTDAAGAVLLSGTAASRAKDYGNSDIENVHKELVAKIADAIVSGAPSGSQNTSAQAAGQDNSQSAPSAESLWQQDAQWASNGAYFNLIARAYRSLPVKPPLPDKARAYQLKAESALKSGNRKAAALAYLSALKIVQWWPEGSREYALLAAQLNRPDVAVGAMRNYLELAPDALDATQMQANIAKWSLLAPPPPFPPTTVPMPPDGKSRLGVMVMDTPDIIASAMNKTGLKGALVTIVMTGSPAEKSGLAQGDIVVGFDRNPVTGALDLANDIKGSPPGAKASLAVLRGQQQLTLTVQL